MLEAPRSTERPPALPMVVLAWVLVGVCVLLPLAGLALGEKDATYRDLRDGVRSGSVGSVVVSGGTTEPFIGRQGVTVRWRQHFQLHVAHVVEQQPLRRTRIDGHPAVRDVAEDLRTLDPDVVVDRHPDDHLTSSWSIQQLPHWQFPSWIGLAWFGSHLMASGLVVAGRKPWRATRWAWFWLLWGLPFVGLLAFLLLGGPTGLLRPAHGRKRLTGGWAFLLVLLSTWAMGAVGAAF